MLETPKVPSRAGVQAEAVREHLERALTGDVFGHSDRLKRLLRFVVEQTLEGKGDKLKEYTLGLEVFDRAPGFDPRVDSIVRVQASKLRDKLSEYYETEGRGEPVRIELPRGSYMPVFQTPDAIARKVLPMPVPVAPASPRQRIKGLLPWLAAGAAVVCAVIFALAQSSRRVSETPAIRFTIPPPEKTAFLPPFGISPDGRRLISTAVSGGRTFLWLRSLEAASGQPLAGTEQGEFVAWSATGRFVLFSANGRLKKLELGSTKLPEEGCTWTGFGADWSRNGTIIVGHFNRGIHRVSEAGGQPVPVTSLDSSRQEYSHKWPHFLPDGQRFLYFAECSNPANNAVHVASLDGKTQRL